MLVWTGRLQPGYGVMELIDLGAALVSRRARCLLMLVGGGPELEEARAAVRQRGLERYVVLPGPQSLPDLQAYLRIATAFVLPFSPTRQNLFRCPTKLFQYIAHNRPIVTNRVGEVGEALGDAGFYCEVGSEEHGRYVPEGDRGGRQLRSVRPYPFNILERSDAPLSSVVGE